jgi:hypothetical protein
VCEVHSKAMVASVRFHEEKSYIIKRMGRDRPCKAAFKSC